MRHRTVAASDAEWRLFAALVGARCLLAPEATLRGRVVQAILTWTVGVVDWAYVRLGSTRVATPGQTSSDLHIDATDAPVAADSATGEPVASEPVASEPVASEPFGTINGPPAGSSVRGMALLWGWALDRATTRGIGVTSIVVYVDGAWQGTATPGINRYDVADQFGPGFVACGWQFALDLQNVRPGPHVVQVAAYSSVSGQETTYSLQLNVEAPLGVPAERKFALFISGCPGGTRRYRCDHQAEQLQLRGVVAHVAVYGEFELADVLDQYELFVLQRVLLSEDVAWFIDQARRRGRAVIYDTDDLVFDLDAVPHIATLELFTPRQKEQFLDCLARGYEALIRCDSVLVSTELLRERAARFHPRVLLSHNVVSQAMVEQAEGARRRRVTRQAHDRGDGRVTMAYLSGTASHDRDFLEAADALVWALGRYTRTRLVTVGPLHLDGRFDQFGNRVEQVALLPWQRLAELIADVDINLGPLEKDNPFTEAKSCIKFLEAALVGVPTIASPRPDFRRAMRDGDTGLLATDQVEWRAALERLIESEDERARMGERARRDVLEHHTSATASPPLLETLHEASRASIRG